MARFPSPLCGSCHVCCYQLCGSHSRGSCHGGATNCSVHRQDCGTTRPDRTPSRIFHRFNGFRNAALHTGRGATGFHPRKHAQRAQENSLSPQHGDPLSPPSAFAESTCSATQWGTSCLCFGQRLGHPFDGAMLTLHFPLRGLSKLANKTTSNTMTP